ncbi:hypothetical protein NIES4072_56910 [Nostoc commune NIES-4072]|uniref:DUF6888 domain-containing protein n=1 Tax=Nostoc commune NIES-4072 TaxID=2005467 RepID=A0A2R5FUL9_NOSCO|nr:hypothetical protein [Nostoc commune]BBD67031.1 hypothetical protein NIES4070_34020 [Nostoc commune HK-02]GBG21985.1 hypothetical protein NIES4072_56910 [Nostoc commune NIES-4072]
MPTQKQSDTAIFLCQLLSNLYQPIQVFRYDQKLKTLYIQAGLNDEIAVIIDQYGNWKFVV